MLIDSYERMMPECAAPVTFWEHIYRYQFAGQFVKGKRVLDIACGTGYGSAASTILGASSVIGIDISEASAIHARQKYKLHIVTGDAESIPLEKDSVDVVISFETIEHLKSPGAFLAECKRVLAPGGLLIVSTPNRVEYQKLAPQNEFHIFEFSLAEFTTILSRYFRQHNLYTQRTISVSRWNARAFAMRKSPWSRVRGVGRLKEHLLRTFCPHIVGNLADNIRSSPEEAIARKESRVSHFLNPYIVRPYSDGAREEPVYFLAVAEV